MTETNGRQLVYKVELKDLGAITGKTSSFAIVEQFPVLVLLAINPDVEAQNNITNDYVVQDEFACVAADSMT